MIRSTAPRHVVDRYLRGQCFVLAIELHRKTGLPLWGMKTEPGPNGEIEHAFVADSARGVGIDIRGERPIAEIGHGARLRDPCYEEITEAQIMAQQFSFDPADVREARRVVRDHFVGLPPKPRATRKPKAAETDASFPDLSAL